MNYAPIEFRPVCSICNHIIESEINGEFMEVGRDDIPGMAYMEFVITPDRCPNCGTYFTGIIIPTRLPYNRDTICDGKE